MKQINRHMAVNVNLWIALIIGFVILLEILADLFPILTSAGDSLNSSGFPLGNLFATGGAIWYILAAAVIYLLIRGFSSKK